MKHHEEAIAHYVARAKVDPEVVAVIVTGSVGRGSERADSDIDLYLIVSDARWDRATESGRIAWTQDEEINYDGGYFDIKLATVSYLTDAALRGDDPVRASFEHARVAWTSDAQLSTLVSRIPQRTDDDWRSLERSFIAQARLHCHYFLRHAEGHADALLLHHAAVHVATSAARAVLARRRVLFPGPKSLTATLESLADAPVELLGLMQLTVERPTVATATRLLALVEQDLAIDLDRDATLPLFINDNELAWRTLVPPPEYR